MNPFNLNSTPISIDPAQLGIGPSLRCHLPCSTEMAERGRTFVALAVKVFQELGELLPEEKLVAKLKSTFDEINQFVMRNRDTGLLQLDMKGTESALEKCYSLLPENTARDLVDSFNELINIAQDYNQHFTRATIRIELDGEPEDVGALAEELIGDVTHIAEQFQQKVADEYGWQRAKTTCCERIGYNPPDGSGFLPAHDVEHKAVNVKFLVVDDSSLGGLLGELGDQPEE